MSLQTLVYNVGFILRKKLWLITLIFLAFLFILPIATGMNLQYHLESLHNSTPALTAEAEQANYDLAMAGAHGVMTSVFGSGNIAVIIFIVIVSFIAAIGFFNWLHKRQKVDLYHGLPISRHQLFAVNYCAGALAVIIPLVANIILTVIIAVAMGFGSVLPLGALFGGLALNILFFLLIYSVVIIAVLLSGNSIVSGILALIFLGIGPATVALYQGLRSLFHPTWYYQLIDWSTIYVYSSPVARYVAQFQEGYSVGIVAALVLLVITAGLYIAATLIYRHRPSEAAQHALAFPKTRAFIKYPLVVLAAAFGGLFFHYVGDLFETWVWYFVGMVLAGFIASQLMEVVYHADFRAIIKRLLPLGIILAIMITGSALMVSDVFGYNKFVPKQNEVAALEINLSGVNRYTAEAHLAYASTTNGVNDTVYIGDIGMDSGTYAELTAATEAEALLSYGQVESEEGIAAAIAIVEKLIAEDGSDYDSDSPYYDPYRNSTTAYIRYTMKDGSIITRSYVQNDNFKIADIIDQLAAIYEDESYRENIYALFQFEPQQIRIEQITSYERYLQQNYENQADSNAFTLLNADIGSLLATYEQELKALSAEQMMQELPIGYISFRVYKDDPGTITKKQKERFLAYQYPVYASFSESLALMADLGISAESWLPDYAAITEIAVISYSDKNRGKEALPAAASEDSTVIDSSYANEVREIYREPEDIRRLVESSYVDSCFYMNSFIESDSTQMFQVSYQNAFGGIDYASRYAKK